MQMLIYLESWQWQCCGDRVGVGSTVEWDLDRAEGVNSYLASVLGPQWSEDVRYGEDHHGSMRPGIRVSGTVRSIRVMTTDHDVVDRVLVPIPLSARLDRVDVVDAWAPGFNHNPHGRMLDGWLVELELDREPMDRPTSCSGESGD